MLKDSATRIIPVNDGGYRDDNDRLWNNRIFRANFQGPRFNLAARNYLTKERLSSKPRLSRISLPIDFSIYKRYNENTSYARPAGGRYFRVNRLRIIVVFFSRRRVKVGLEKRTVVLEQKERGRRKGKKVVFIVITTLS